MFIIISQGRQKANEFLHRIPPNFPIKPYTYKTILKIKSNKKCWCILQYGCTHFKNKWEKPETLFQVSKTYTFKKSITGRSKMFFSFLQIIFKTCKAYFTVPTFNNQSHFLGGRYQKKANDKSTGSCGLHSLPFVYRPT